MAENNRHIYLMGFMGCGKTKIGELLAKLLNRPFIDTDTCIVEETGLSINEIFERRGEQGFREIEKTVVGRLSKTDGCVISLGGGSVINPENWEHITKSGITITLSYPPEILMARLDRKKDRPLLNKASGSQRLDLIRDMLEAREPYYRRADLVLHLNREIDAQNLANMLFHFLEGFK
jgi:shikimate kinase